MELWLAFAIAVGINVALFVPAFFMKTDKLTDFSYGLSFAVVAITWFVLHPGGLRDVLFTLIVVTWAVRLGSYLVIRIRRMKRDKRFDGIRENFFRCGGFWLGQGVTVFVVLLPTLLVLPKPDSIIPTQTWIGFVVAVAAIAFEGIADWQKYTFINNPKNKGKWIASGLWAWSRHPNYFGEIMVWTGLYIAALPYLTGWEPLLGLLSPWLITATLLFVTGIPKLEAGADKRWGDNPAYQAYKKRTSVLIPLPPK